MKNKAYNTIKNRIMEQRKSLEDLTNIADLDFAITELNEIDGMIELAQVLQVNQDLIDELKNEVATNFDIILKKLKANEIFVHEWAGAADAVLSISKILAGITAKSECKNYLYAVVWPGENITKE